MKYRKLSFLMVVVAFCASLLIHPTLASAQSAQEIKLDGASLQEVLDRLFGTSETTGLLQGDKAFDFRAQELVLTGPQADQFFIPSISNSADFSDLIAAAESIKGAGVRIDGTLNGTPFDLKIAGKEVKADGLVLTQTEFDALVSQLKATPGLKEAKINATVDGRMVELKLENSAGRVRVEDKGLAKHDVQVHDTNHAGDNKRDKNDARLEAANHGSPLEKVDHLDKVERVEKVERPEQVERVQRLERVEKLERPEVDHGGAGRH